MKYFFLLLSAVFLLSFSSIVFADDITMTVNQTDYYFLTGEPAQLTFQTENTYGKDIAGMLTYTTTQQINQQGYRFSSSNTQATSATIKKDDGVLVMDFGTSDGPGTITASITFSYSEKEQREVVLDDINIHFVADESQKQNQENSKQSSSQTSSQHSGQQNSQQNSQSSQQQQQAQQSAAQKQKNAVQNNQMDQDAGALKQEMQRQREEYAQMQQKIADQLGKDPQVNQAHQEILEQGYNMTSFEIDPESNETGNFNMQYRRADGETASISGRLQNSTLEDFKKRSSAEQKQMQQQMMQDPRFQNLSRQLEQEGYNQTGFRQSEIGNSTQMTAEFQGPGGQKANITAQFQNATITQVEMDREDQDPGRIWSYTILIVVLVLVLLGYYLYSRHRSRKDPASGVHVKNDKPIDHRKESRKMLEKARELFASGHEKDAYEMAGRALRFYHTHELGHRKELTNTRTIDALRKHKKPYKDVQNCLNMCGMVEFAKYEANKNDFHKITEIVEKEIGR